MRNYVDAFEKRQPQYDLLGQGTGASPCAAMTHGNIQPPKKTDVRSDDLTEGQHEVKISELLKWVKDYPAGDTIRTDDFPAKNHFMSTFLILLKRYHNDDCTPSVFHPILTWHFLYSAGIVRESPDATKLMLNDKGRQLYGLTAIARIDRLLMKPGGSSFKLSAQGKMIRKSIYADAACAAMTLALNGLEQGVTEFLERSLRNAKQHTPPGPATTARRGIFSFTCSSNHRKRHQDEKMDILCSTDDWERGRIFDATFLNTLRDVNGKPILSDTIIKQYFDTFGDGYIDCEDMHGCKWPPVTSLADNVLERLQDRRMKINTV